MPPPLLSWTQYELGFRLELNLTGHRACLWHRSTGTPRSRKPTTRELVEGSCLYGTAVSCRRSNSVMEVSELRAF